MTWNKPACIAVNCSEVDIVSQDIHGPSPNAATPPPPSPGGHCGWWYSVTGYSLCMSILFALDLIQQSKKYFRSSGTLIILSNLYLWALTVTDLEDSKLVFFMTFYFIMMHHHARFACKRFSRSEKNSLDKHLLISILPLLWPWPCT